MKKLFLVLVVSIGLLCWLTPLLAAQQDKDVGPVLSLLLSGSLFSHLDSSKQYTPHALAVIKVKGKSLNQGSYSGEISGKTVTLQKSNDNTLAFYLPVLTPGKHTLTGTVEGEAGRLDSDMTAYTPVANPESYVNSFIGSIIGDIDLLIVENIGENAALVAQL